MEVEKKERELMLAKSTAIGLYDNQSENTENTTNTATPEAPAKIPGVMNEQMAFYTKLMIMACLLSECLLSFVTFSNELFLVHALSGFCTNLSAEDVLGRVSRVKLVAALCSIIFGLVMDSHLYRVRYWVILSCSSLLITWPSLYLVLTYPVLWEGENVEEKRLYVFYLASTFHGLVTMVHQSRIALVLDRALEDYKSVDSRRFIGLLVFAQQFGEVAAGFAIWISRSSRTLYTGLMCINIALSLVYSLFWFLWTHRVSNDDKPYYACVERALVSSTCYVVKRIDLAWCRGLTFEKHYGWQDYRCIHFSERTAANSWCLLTSLLVLLPLVGYFVTDAGINYLYVAQYSFFLYQDENFSVMAYKATYFLILYPVFEFLIFPKARKFLRWDLTRLLLSIGVGGLFMGLAVASCALIQQKMSPVEQDVVNVLSKTVDTLFTHAVIVNLVDSDSEIRGEYFNHVLVEPKNAWKILKPYDPFKVLNFPMNRSPFNISVRNDYYKIYDDYSFWFRPFIFNWLVIHPMGMFALAPGTFHQTPQIGMNPSMFRPALVNIICRIPVCKGILEFRRDGRYHVRVFFPFRDEIRGIETFELAGKYEVGFSLVGNKSTETIINVEFRRLKVYLLVISGHSTQGEEKTKINVVRNTNEEALMTTVWILLVPTFFHAMAYIFTNICLLEWLHKTCRRDLRCFIFSIPTFLTTITYYFFSRVNVTLLQTITSMKMFTYACVIWILLIVYGVTCLRYVRLWNRLSDSSKPNKAQHKKSHKHNNQTRSLHERKGSNEDHINGEKDKDS